MVDHAFACIHNEHHDVGILNRLQGLDHRELFHRLEDLAAATHASGIYQGVLLVIALERDVDAVAGGTGLVIHNDPFFTQHAVDQGRLTNVRPADDRQLDAVLLARAGNALGFLTFENDLFFLALFRLGGILGEGAQHGFEHLSDTATVSTGNRQGLAHTHAGKLGAGQVGVDVVDLVDDQEAALVTATQVLTNHLIGSGQPGAGIHQKQHGIRFFDGLQRLLGHLRVNAFLVTGNTTGVDDDIGSPLPLGLAVLAITGQTRQVADNRVTGLGQAVKQGGLADVRAAHQGNYGNH